MAATTSASGWAAIAAPTAARAVGRPLRRQELSPEQERARLPADPGFSGAFVGELLGGYATMAASAPPAVTSAVPGITGSPATPMRVWAAGHAADFGGGQG
ncbi:hypothetical protein [Nonomuraea typhae]|uniref:hypothetical protein n=1 Tax=Nonomuraea typhae TaxID=2603600 RepID=UPI0012F87856|nr:hypothetical protein [Nonomuraea typhae]